MAGCALFSENALCLGSADGRLRMYRRPASVVGRDGRAPTTPVQGELSLTLAPTPKISASLGSGGVVLTCMDWQREWPGSVDGGSRKRTMKTRAAAPPNSGLMAVGTRQGQVLVWNLQRGVVEAVVLDEGGEGKAVESVAFGTLGTQGDVSLFVACGDGIVRVVEQLEKTSSWGIHRRLKAIKRGTHSLRVHPSGEVLAAGGSGLIRLVDVKSGKKIRTFHTGQKGVVGIMAFSPDGRFLASTELGGRMVNLFVCGGDNATSTSATRTFTLGISISFLELWVPDNDAAADETTAPMTLVAGGREGISVIRASTMGSGATESITTCDVKRTSPPLGTQTRKEGRILAACLDPESQASGLVIASEGVNSFVPNFESIRYVTDAGGMETVVHLSNIFIDGGKSPLPNATLNSGVEQVHVVKPGEMGIEGMEVSEMGVNHPVALPENEAKNDNFEEDQTMASRLAELSRKLNAELEDKKDGNKVEPKRIAASPESLVTALSQALQTEDDTLLDQCLDVVDQKVVNSTVARLSSTYVLPLLHRLVAKFERRPARGASLCVWVRSVLSTHTGYLLGVPELAQELAGLQQMISMRLSTYEAFLNLSGRLELVLNHQHAHSAECMAQEHENGKPPLVYEESGDEEDVDVEDNVEVA